jgi:hypothetical protein
LVVLPVEAAASTMRSAISGEELSTEGGTIRVAAALAKLPAAVLGN